MPERTPPPTWRILLYIAIAIVLLIVMGKFLPGGVV
jgi:hypothetical protein